MGLNLPHFVIRPLALLAALAAAGPARAGGPAEFGLSELRAAMEQRGLSRQRLPILTEYSMVLPHDGFSILGNIIRGGSQRGLMYGLLEAAAQIRRQGRLSPAKGEPATPIRGIRWFVHNAELEAGWYHDREHWQAFFQMLARNRFNRFTLVFAHQTAYLAPPYPFWVRVPEFPEVRAKGLSDEERERNLATLRSIAQTAADYGVDFVLGIWEHDVQRGMEPSVEGLTPDNIGPYSYAALKMVLAACPGIRGVQMRTNSESGIPAARQTAFYRDWVFRALRECGRLVHLDLRGWLMQEGLFQAALEAQVPLRLSSKYWAEHLGRPYPPAETWPNYSFLDFLEKPGVSDRDRAWQFYWELWGLGSHRLLLWGDPDYVRRAVPTFTMSGAAGFEMDPPLAQKGFGNRPGQWGVFDASQKKRVFWKWEWERYWLFYLLWGRLSYNPGEPEQLWTGEFERRFGAAGADVLRATRSASKVLNEIVAVHLADPNMYIWPEVNPGGLLDSYQEVRPSDWRMVASFEENTTNRLQGRASAKQRAVETAARLREWALETEQAVEGAQRVLGDAHREWLGTKPDLQALALLARFHGRRQMAADHLAWFEATGDGTALYAARREAGGALRTWQELVELTTGLYPAEMAFGPDDVGHWKDRLPYLEHDMKLLEERVARFEKYGPVRSGFDFGGAVQEPKSPGYRQTRSVVANNVEPGFQAVAPETAWREGAQAGWLGQEPREAVALPLSPYREVRGVASEPGRLPRHALMGDFIAGAGPQVFRVKAEDGAYRVVLLKPDGTDETRTLAASGGVLDVAMPDGAWRISGVLVQGGPERRVGERWPRPVARPGLDHAAPKAATAGKALTLALRVWPVSEVTAVRLHYRPLNQLAAWKTAEAPPQRAVFTIPGAEVDARWDLQYYFEVLNSQGTGWFVPDPQMATPYHVVAVTVDTAPLPEGNGEKAGGGGQVR